MEKVVNKIIFILLGMVILFIFFEIFREHNRYFYKGFDKGYKQGQIDALNGIQNYDKIVKQDTIYIKIR